MHTFVTGALSYIEIESNILVEDFIKISPNMKKPEVIAESIDFHLQVGWIRFKDLLVNPIHFSTHNSTEENDGFDTSSILGIQVAVIQQFMIALWMVKDNSTNSIDSFYYDTENKGTLALSTLGYFSNSKGNYESVKFTENELRDALEWYQSIKEYFKSIGGEIEIDVTDLKVHNNTKNDNALTSDRISRAFNMIISARRQSYLPAKISSYISAIEALVSSDRGALAMQVSERAPKIIGGTKEEKIKNSEKLKKAYSLRSTFVHGSKVNKPIGTLEEVSQNIDDILRSLIKKIISEYEETKNLNGEKLQEWYRDNFMF